MCVDDVLRLEVEGLEMVKIFILAEGLKNLSFLALSGRESSLVQTFVNRVYTLTLPIYPST